MPDDQRRHQSSRFAYCWVILTNLNENAVYRYQVEKKSLSNLPEFIVFISSQRCSIIRQMPSCMNAVLQAIYERRISCSFCYEVLLNYLGMTSERFSYSSLVADYGDGGLLGFSLHCIKVVYHGYISRGLAAIDVELDNLPHSRYEYIKMFTCCKDRAYRRTMQVRDSERYLGIRSFEDELRRSFDEFLMIVKNVFGFWPYIIGEERPINSPM